MIPRIYYWVGHQWDGARFPNYRIVTATDERDAVCMICGIEREAYGTQQGQVDAGPFDSYDEASRWVTVEQMEDRG